MQSVSRNWKILIALNLTLGIIQVIGMYTDFEFENPFLNFFFPVFITTLAIISIIKLLRSKISLKWLLTILCLPSLVAGFPHFILFPLIFTPAGGYATGLLANELNARPILAEFPSPDKTKIAIVYYTPPKEGGNIGIYVKLKYRFLPLFVRSIYEDAIDFDWNSPFDPNIKYNLVWIDNQNIQVGKSKEQLNVSQVKLVNSKIFDALSFVYEWIFPNQDR